MNNNCKNKVSYQPKVSYYRNIQTEHVPTVVKADTNKKNFLFKICSKIFTLKQNLNRHMQTLHQIDSKPPSATNCSLSDSIFLSIVILSEHLVETHQVELERDLVFNSVTGTLV